MAEVVGVQRSTPDLASDLVKSQRAVLMPRILNHRCMISSCVLSSIPCLQCSRDEWDSALRFGRHEVIDTKAGNDR